MPNVLIFGSGPVGVSVAKRLLSTGDFNVLMVDSATTLDNLQARPSSAFKRDFPRQPKSTSTEGRHNSLVASAVGGFSLVWGATWGRMNSLSNKGWISAYLQADAMIRESEFEQGPLKLSGGIFEGNEICGCLADLLPNEEENSSVTFKPSCLALLCNNSERIESSSTSSFYVWDSTVVLEEMKKDNRLRFIPDIQWTYHDFFAEKHSICIDQRMEYFDYIVLAAGTIGNMALLGLFDKSPSRFLIQDTQMSYLPILKIKKIKSGSFGLSHLVSETTTESRELEPMHTQYYTHLFENSGLFIKRLPRSIEIPARIILWLLRNHLVVAINYLPASRSGIISFTRNQITENSEISFCSDKGLKTNQRNYLRVLSRELRSKGYFTHHLLAKNVRLGHSFHSGAAITETWGHLGLVKDVENLYVAGAASLPTLEPGPVTTSAMAQGIRVAEDIIAKCNSIN